MTSDRAAGQSIPDSERDDRSHVHRGSRAVVTRLVELADTSMASSGSSGREWSREDLYDRGLGGATE